MKRMSSFLCLILCLLLSLSACTPDTNGSSSVGSASSSAASESSVSSSPTTGKADKDSLVVGYPAEPNNMDPQENSIIPGMMAEKQLYESLINKNTNGEFEPSLATAWEWVDSTHLKLSLREGVTFHDGSPFSAEDVAFTVSRLKKGAASGTLYEPFDAENTEILDDHTVILAFKYNFSPALNFLTNARSYIVSKSYCDANGEEALKQNPMGTGPFMLAEWLIGSYTRMERYDGYWGEKPVYKNLTIRWITEDASRMMGLETGEIDIVSELSSSDLAATMAGNKEGIIAYTTESFKIFYIAFNESFEPFQSKEVRLAMAHAVDWTQACEVAGGDTCVPAESCLASTIFGYESQGLYEYDVEKAKELMQQAGYGDGFTVEVIEHESPINVRMLEVLQAYYMEVGIVLNIQTTDAPTKNEAGLTGEADFNFGNMTANTGDPFHTLSNAVESAANITGRITDPHFNELSNAGIQEMDETKRAEIYHELQRYVFEEALMIPMWEQIVNYAARDYITNFTPDPGFQLDLKSVVIL